MSGRCLIYAGPHPTLCLDGTVRNILWEWWNQLPNILTWLHSHFQLQYILRHLTFNSRYWLLLEKTGHEGQTVATSPRLMLYTPICPLVTDDDTHCSLDIVTTSAPTQENGEHGMLKIVLCKLFKRGSQAGEICPVTLQSYWSYRVCCFKHIVVDQIMGSQKYSNTYICVW